MFTKKELSILVASVNLTPDSVSAISSQENVIQFSSLSKSESSFVDRVDDGDLLDDFSFILLPERLSHNSSTIPVKT